LCDRSGLSHNRQNPMRRSGPAHFHLEFGGRRGPAEMTLEARLLGIISTEFVAEELTARRPPRLNAAVHDRQRLAAECANESALSDSYVHW
jgi:hypothetical protein